MSENLIMRCGAKNALVVGVTDSGIISSVLSYDIKMNVEEGSLEDWLIAFSATISQIPKKIREKITFVIPPNKSVLIKHITIPEVTTKSAQEAFKFECENSLPGGSEDWKWDIYRINEKSTHAYVFAMRINFSERFADVLLRNKIQFSYICPEILLNNVAIEKCLNGEKNVMLINVGEEVSYLSCIGDSELYMRMIDVSGCDLNKTISSSQNITLAQADVLQKKFENKSSGEDEALMSYYVKQFTQQVRQEIKRSELFYCRTFNQQQIEKVYITGNKGPLYEIFQKAGNVIEVSLFDVLRDRVSSSLSEDDVALIRGTIGCFIGALYYSLDKNTNFLQILSSDFISQVEFQRQNFGYVLFAFVCTILILAVLISLNKDVKKFDSNIASLESKISKIAVDSDEYGKLLEEERKLKAFVKDSNTALSSQTAWVEFLEELQSKISKLKTAWVESMHWTDKAKTKTCDKLEINAKMIILDGKPDDSIGKFIENFVDSLSQSKKVSRANILMVGNFDDHTIEFSVEVMFNEKSGIIVL